MSAKRNYIAIYRHFPFEMFRVNDGPNIVLREYGVKRQRSFDVISSYGKVEAKYKDPRSYRPPNGLSVRPDSKYNRDIIQGFRGKEVTVWKIPANTPVPNDLVLVHEYSDHYSLQPKDDMAIADLNTRLTQFLESLRSKMSRERWSQVYASVMLPGASVSSSASSSASDTWVKYPDRDYYYCTKENQVVGEPTTSPPHNKWISIRDEEHKHIAYQMYDGKQWHTSAN